MSTEKAASSQASGRKVRRDSVESLLVSGETVVTQAVIHNGIYWQSFAVFLMAIFVGLLVFELGVILAVTAILMFSYATFRKEVLMLVLTNKRMLFRYGILQVDVVDMRFSKIESIELERMAPGYLMGYSNVVIMGTGNRYIFIPYVANGPEIRQAYNRLTLSESNSAADDE